MSSNAFDQVEQVTMLGTNSIGGSCTICRKFSPSSTDEPMQWLQSFINHYLSEHHCVLIHVGQETTRDDTGKPWQYTVAVIGRKRD
jgi:hypothetical protein